MSIKSFRLLWIRLETSNKRSISFSLPISLYVFQELLDCILDLLSVACFFVPKVSTSKVPDSKVPVSKVPNTNSSSRITIYSIKELVIIFMKLLESLTEDEPYELVDVTTDEVKVLIKIR